MLPILLLLYVHKLVLSFLRQLSLHQKELRNFLEKVKHLQK
uniref:Uncharacterized protein n=1 Tax=Siphoviridae sp. ct2D011 TaxID=2825314 RepID=A0A8S5V9I3_9CAUD|nr:MAG TPA: hypothetical protein [Siphoviridae sp. ct2D011]